MKLFNIHYAEIALKGLNRSEFENRLVENIKYAVGRENFESVRKEESRILLYANEKTAQEHIKNALACVFGISWFAFSHECKSNIEEIKKTVEENIPSYYAGKKLRAETRRADKNFPKTSMEVSSDIGHILTEKGFEINLTNPEATVEIEILKDRALIMFERFHGLGGLPVGCSGNVLALLSGGIDSPVAAWLMMKRGCSVNILHLHPYSNNEQVKSSKITKLAKKLREFSPKPIKIYIAPYNAFYKKTFALRTKSELVLFRRFLIQLANELALRDDFLGLVTGDSIGQVASQTLENLKAANKSTLPVYRPLITYDKKDIITLAEKIGTYRTSLEEYRDCCSLVATKHPATRTKIEEMERIEKEINMKSIIDETMKEIEVIEV